MPTLRLCIFSWYAHGVSVRCLSRRPRRDLLRCCRRNVHRRVTKTWTRPSVPSSHCNRDSSCPRLLRPWIGVIQNPCHRPHKRIRKMALTDSFLTITALSCAKSVQYNTHGAEACQGKNQEQSPCKTREQEPGRLHLTPGQPRGAAPTTRRGTGLFDPFARTGESSATYRYP